MAEKIKIILSTYNGAKYLPEQIQSLQAQSIQTWELIVRDDGSLDQSLNILKSAAERDTRIRIMPNDGKNLGAIQSFSSLMGEAKDADYLFFCDQDDYWKPHKLSRSLELLRNAERIHGPLTPIAVHSDLSICDEKLGVLEPSMKMHSRAQSVNQDKLFMPLLGQNFVTGCTLGINQALLKVSLPIPYEALMHDWWIALVAAALGRIIFISEPLVLYRQHGKNASGTAFTTGLLGGARKFISHFHELDELMKNRFKQSQALEKHLSKFAPNKALEELTNFHRNLKTGAINGVKAGLNAGLRLESPARSIAYYLLLAKNGKALLP